MNGYRVGGFGLRPYRTRLIGQLALLTNNVAIDYNVAMGYVLPMKPVSYTRDALKVLRRMPMTTAKRITSKINAYANDPASQANNVTALKGRDGIRMRVGDWRVIMRDGEVLAVLQIGSRGSIYND